ncbi:MAG: putative outer membrane protein involved in nutrient binding [Flavisolibacter sp.]|jgi:TonB-linked SusC/RagA family outer membrane protein|nr:putative outer membrane protein involved in nutrient binding [Flavisolibacter sp.]
MRKSRILQLLLFSLLSFSFHQAVAQSSSIKGRINNEKGEPLVGATVSVKGKGSTVTTREDGRFVINAMSKDVLVITSIGYETREVAIDNQTDFAISLTTRASTMNEVIVVGYGSQNRRDITGSIARIDKTVLSSVPVSSFDAAMQGRAAGVQVIQSTGMAGAGAQIRIRGVGSITSGGEPLYVIDGIPIAANSGQTLGAINENPLASINTNDIESIEILKDASAAAIYGSRGANGVILITTKRGTKGKPKINFSSRLSLVNITRRLDMLNSQEFITLYKEAVANDYKFNPTGAPASLALPGNIPEATALRTDTDWQDATTHTGLSSFNDLSVSMGNNKLRGYFGLSYVDEKSFLVNDNFKRSSARLNLDYSPFTFLKVGANLSFSYTDQNHIPVGFDGGYGRAVSNALPYFPIYNDTGALYRFPVSTNPVAEINNRTRKTRGQRSLASLFTDINILKELTVRIEGNLDYSHNEVYALTTRVLATSPSASKNRRYLTNWNGKALVNYAMNIKNIHRLKFMVGSEILKNVSQSNTRNVTFVAGQEDWLFNNPVLPLEINANGTPNTNNRYTVNNPSEYSFLSYFGRVNYTLKDRYMLTGTIRADGSSRFGTNNKFGTFPALSAGWILTEENFMKKYKAISYLKLKAGYGLTGNAEIGNYAQWGLTNNANTLLYNSMQYFTISSLANPNLRWETTAKTDLGIEYGFLNNRITGEVSYYVNNSKDLFQSVSTSTSTGYGSILGNVGKLRNKGIEFSINSKNIVKKNFTWNTNFNISRNTNKVLDIGTAGPDALGGNGDTRVIVGKPIGSNYLVRTLYIDPADGLPVYEMLDAAKQVAGTTKVYNTQRDRQVVGHPYPDVIGGIDNRFTWKSFDFGFFGTFQIGGNIFDDAEKFQMNSIGAWNLRAKALTRWQKPGDITSVPRLSMGLGGLERTRNTTEFLHDASYFRLKTISLGYNLPKSLVKYALLSGARLSFSATNIFTISSYDGDPEVFRDAGSAQARNLSPNVSYLTPPQSRSYTIQLNLNF